MVPVPGVADRVARVAHPHGPSRNEVLSEDEEVPRLGVRARRVPPQRFCQGCSHPGPVGGGIGKEKARGHSGANGGLGLGGERREDRRRGREEEVRLEVVLEHGGLNLAGDDEQIAQERRLE